MMHGRPHTSKSRLSFAPKRSIALALIAAVSVIGQAATAAGQGLTVQDGEFYRDGQRYRGLGINYYDAFLRTVRDQTDTSYDAGFAGLADKDIPFARFNAGGFSADDWRAYEADKTGYFQRMDAVVASATSHGVQLIPSLFWNARGIAEYHGEPVSAWDDPNSETRRFVAQYTTEVVSRYADNDTILMWEFGNEFNLIQDLPTGGNTGRTADEVFSSDGVRAAMADFGNTVRTLDPNRALTSGHSVARPAALSLREDGVFSRDTAAEFRRITQDDHPDPLDTLSVHAYYHSLLGNTRSTQDDPTNRFGANPAATYAEVIEQLQQAATAADKALFFGEFGVADDFFFDVPDDGNEDNTTRERLEFLLQQLSEAEIDLAALWVYDRVLTEDVPWNITTTNDRSYHLDLIGEVNAQWQASIPEPATGIFLMSLCFLAHRRRLPSA